MCIRDRRDTEEHARRLAQYDNLTLVCGHYEGIDERVIDAFADEEISIGDYILTEMCIRDRMVAASYRSAGTPFRAARNSTMAEPNCQMRRKQMIHSA